MEILWRIVRWAREFFGKRISESEQTDRSKHEGKALNEFASKRW
jgi:hypothetical protein